jgi:hypothetical protein
VTAAMSEAGGTAQPGLSRWMLVVVVVGMIGDLGLVLAYFARAGVRGRQKSSGPRRATR